MATTKEQETPEQMNQNKTLKQYHIYLDKFNHDPRISDLFTSDGTFILKGANFGTIISKGPEEISKAFKNSQDATKQCTHLFGQKIWKNNKEYHNVMSIEESNEGHIMQYTGEYVVEFDKDSDNLKSVEINVKVANDITENKKGAEEWLSDTHTGDYAWFN